MTLQDVSTLARKILVGVIVFIVPLLLFLGGLWLVRHLL